MSARSSARGRRVVDAGRSAARGAPRDRPEVGYCPECLHVVSLRDDHCHRCGQKLRPEPADRVLGSAVFLAAAVCWLAIAAAVAGFWF